MYDDEIMKLKEHEDLLERKVNEFAKAHGTNVGNLVRFMLRSQPCGIKKLTDFAKVNGVRDVPSCCRQ
jgi:predicted PolB exonuclease-like 3'-5' exonuclease